MSNPNRADKQLLVALFGITTSLLTGTILGAIEVYSGFALYSWMFWFVIPVGAFLAGFGAASGYYAGAMLFQQKPAGGILFNMVAASVSAFLIVHYVPYFMLEFEGVRIKHMVSFWKYLDISIRNTSLSLVRGSTSTGELGGFWGYAYASLQVIGFSVGGFAVFGWLSRNPYCDSCSRYLTKSGQQERFTSEGQTLIEEIQNFASMLDGQKYNDAIKYHAEKMGVAYSSGHHLRTKLITRVCQGCGINHLDFIASKLDGNDWKDIDETEIQLSVEEQLETA
ncbi:MAG: hypothetical protein ACE5KZ_16270 [Candidatus Scalinduaceae bacterium]